MWSVYVGDSNIVDCRTARGLGNVWVGNGVQLLGTPIAPQQVQDHKHIKRSPGVVTDLAKAISNCVLSLAERKSV